MLSKASAQSIDRLAQLETLAATSEQQHNWRRTERLYARLIPLLRARYGLCHEKLLYAAESLANARSWLAHKSRRDRDFWCMQAIAAYELGLQIVFVSEDALNCSDQLRRVHDQRIASLHWHIGEMYVLCKRDESSLAPFRLALFWKNWENRDQRGGERLHYWSSYVKALLRLGLVSEAEDVLGEALRIVGDSILSNALLKLQERTYRLKVQQVRNRRREIEALLACPTTPVLQDLSPDTRQTVLTPCSPVLLQVVAENVTFQISLQESYVVVSSVRAGEPPALETMIAIRYLEQWEGVIPAPLPDGTSKIVLAVTDIDYRTGHLNVRVSEGVQFCSPHEHAGGQPVAS